MFPRAAAGAANAPARGGQGRGVQLGRWQQPGARRCPRSSASCRWRVLAEEIETPGDGQVRALITIAGNPVLSTPERARGSSAALDVARLHGRDRHLPQRDDPPRRRDPAGAVAARAAALRPRALPARRAQRRQLLAAGVRRRRRPSRPGVGDLLRLAGDRRGRGAGRRRRRARRLVASSVVRRAATTRRVAGRGPRRRASCSPSSSRRRGPERMLDFMLRTGPYGDGFGAGPTAVARGARASPHGVDLGPLEPRLPEVLRTPSGKIELAPPAIVADVAAAAGRARPPPQRRASC